MAIVVTIAGTERTQVTQADSISISQLAASFTFTAELTIFDEDSDIAIVVGSQKEADEITIVDGATTFFGGFVANQDTETAEGGSRLLKLQCQGYGIRLNETLIGVESYAATADATIIDDLFDTYLAAFDSVTHVATIDAALTIDFPISSLAEAMAAICARTGGRWYIDNDKKVHYFADEGNDAGFKLSDEPNDVDSFTYLDGVTKQEDASAIINRVQVIGADGLTVTRNDSGGGSSQDTYGIRAMVVTDQSLTTTTQLEEAGDAILAANKDPKVTYVVQTSHDGAVAGNEIGFKCDDLDYDAITGADDALVIREMEIFWEQSLPVYKMSLGDVEMLALTRAASTETVLRQVVIDPIVPLASRGWAHDLVFSATDFNTVAWAGGGTITTAGGTASFSIDAGNTGNIAAITYIYLDVAVSSTVLQTSGSAANAVGSGKILICACQNVADEDTNKAVFQVFGGEGAGVLITADNVAADTLTANEIAANAITASEINANAVTADKIFAGAVTTVKLAAQAVTADKLSIGDMLFDTTDGLLLLNSPIRIQQEGAGAAIANYQFGKRGEKARIGVNAATAAARGSVHLVPGRWPGTKALSIEIAETNDNVNPLMYDGDTDGEADDWTTFDDAVGAPTWTVVDHPDDLRGWLQRVQYTGVGGDANENILFYARTAAASYAEADPCTFSVDYKGSVSGCVAAIRIVAESNVNANLGISTLNLSPRANMQRAKIVFASLPANTDHVRCQLMFDANIDDGDVLDVYVGAVNIEKNNHGTTLIHGNAGEGYSWAGTENDSIAARTKSYLLLDELVGLISENDTLSFRFVIQAPYDHDAEWPGGDWQQFIMSARDSGDAANTYLEFRYNENVNRFTFTVNTNNTILYPAEYAFSKGDWLDIWVTLDYANDEYYIYIAGVERDSATDTEASTALDSWTLGASYLEGHQSGWAFAEFAVFDRVVTAVEVAQLFNLQRPLVDFGSQEKPGIYIIDGQFRIQSSQTGNRIVLTPEEIAGYDAANAKQFYLQASDGKALAGGGVVVLDENGIDIAVTDAEATVRAYKFNLAGVNIGGLYGLATAAGGWLRLYAIERAAKTSSIDIQALAPTAYEAQTFIRAKSGATDVKLTIKADSDAGTPGYGNLTGTTYFDFAAGYVSMLQLRARATTDLEIKLADAAGGKHLEVLDSADQVQFRLTSTGRLYFEPGTQYLYRSGVDLWWFDGTNPIKLN